MSETTRPNLASSFAAPAAKSATGKNRAAGLEGLIPTRPNRTNTGKSEPATQKDEPKPAPVIEDAAPEAPITPAAPERAASAPAPKPVAVIEDDTKLRTRPAYVPPSIFEKAQAETKRRDITYTDLLVEAFEVVADAELAEAFTAVRPESSGMPARARRPRGTGGLQMNLRLDGEQERWLDQKQAAVGAPSRSALVSTVFKLASRSWEVGER